MGKCRGEEEEHRMEDGQLGLWIRALFSSLSCLDLFLDEVSSHHNSILISPPCQNIHHSSFRESLLLKYQQKRRSTFRTHSEAALHWNHITGTDVLTLQPVCNSSYCLSRDILFFQKKKKNIHERSVRKVQYCLKKNKINYDGMSIQMIRDKYSAGVKHMDQGWAIDL